MFAQVPWFKRGWAAADVSDVDALHALELLLAALGGALAAVIVMRRAERATPQPVAEDTEELPRDPTAVVERAAVTAEIERRLASATLERPLLVGVFDVDDFHGYADLFGLAAGEALLGRLGAALVRAVGGGGSVHRTGPAEFSIVAPIAEEGPDRMLSVAAAALFEEGRGFSVGCSQGAALLPAEASDAATALRLAGERLREHRKARRAARRGRAGDALAAALREHDELKLSQRRELADLAEDTARKLGVPEGEVEQIRIAAGLHDVGKMAIPEGILDKAGPLDEEEWAFLRRHTAIGERIVAAAPDLGDAAAIVRSIPERWDGRGYPDGLSGPRIPLGARVVAVCSAYDAMTTTKPYRRAMPIPAALAELRRFAGVQFDPDVVEAFCLALLDHPVER